MILYLAGPMTGHPEENYPAFTAASKALREQGHLVLNPAENFGGDRSVPREVAMRADIGLLLACDAIALMDGWATSDGAVAERLVAEQIGLRVLRVAPGGRLVELRGRRPL